jgi:hypothetical protein
MQLYKLTSKDGYTRKGELGETWWYPGRRIKKPRGSYQLCTDTVIHAYRSKELALLLNPLHADFSDPLLWECEGKVEVEDWGKVGCSMLITLTPIPCPDWYLYETLRIPVLRTFTQYCSEAAQSIKTQAYTLADDAFVLAEMSRNIDDLFRLRQCAASAARDTQPQYPIDLQVLALRAIQSVTGDV